MKSKDKRKYRATRPEKEDWREVKQTKKGFMPEYTRLKHKNGVVATSAERPDNLADYFEKIQWGNRESAETKAARSKVMEFRNNLLVKDLTPIRQTIGDNVGKGLEPSRGLRFHPISEGHSSAEFKP